MNFIQVVLGVTGYRQAGHFDKNCRDPRGTQERLLRRILELNAGTEFGKDHNFRSIRTIEEYQRAVPKNSYKDLEPYILRTTEGEINQLTMDPPSLFATTSGTTGTPKYIPITKSSRRDKSLAMRLWLYHAAQDHPKMFDGQILAVVSPEVEGYTQSGIPYGAESGHAYRNMPSVTQTVYAIPYEVFALEDYESKYYTLLRLAAGKDISMIGTCNPSTILLLARKLNEYKSRILKDIYVGGIDQDVNLPPELRQELESHLKPDPERSIRLEHSVGKEGKLLPRDVWPNLALIGCWKGGSVGLYLREFAGLFDPATPIRDWGYLASEVRGSIPLRDEGCGGVLAIETNFYEFVEESESENPNAEFLTADRLEEGKRYFVYPTTTGGLYRYEMNDLIGVTGFYERTPIVEFIQKGKGVSSLTGEKLYESQVCAAVGNSSGVESGDYEFIVSTPEWGEPPRYIFLVEEEEGTIPDDRWRTWLRSVDEELKRQNEEYASKRKSIRLANPAVKVVKPGEFLRYRQKRVAEGAPDGQFKMLKLTPDLEFQKKFELDRTIELD
ncbi:MAG: GH3 auxin-responsive promoter family protein [Candidatus Omnitrophica bacterium]|nr:GH3 auxin-responsive promoter family protein [Candidatus Omnitrophota bacterium]